MLKKVLFTLGIICLANCIMSNVLAGMGGSVAQRNIYRTEQYTPILKQETYTEAQSGTTIWTPSYFDKVVCDAYIVSTQDNQEITLRASNTIVTLNVLASSPTVSPGGFLFKGILDETILIDTDMGGVSVTLTGWEEN